MKKNEIAILIMIVGIAGLASYFIVGGLVSGSKPKPITLDKAVPISSQIVQPNEALFKNPNAFNPTIKVNIGNQSNQQPFNTSR